MNHQQQPQTGQTEQANWEKDFNEKWGKPWHVSPRTGKWIGPMPYDETDRKQLLFEAKTQMQNGQTISMNYLNDLAD